MQRDNSTENVFRFVQMRPAAAADTEGPIELAGDTELARGMAPATVAERRRYAVDVFEGDRFERFLSTPAVDKVLDAVRTALDKGERVVDLAKAMPVPSGELRQLAADASDLLLAAKYASTSRPRLRDVETVFRAATAVGEAKQKPGDRLLGDELRRPLVVPASFTRPRRPRAVASASDRPARRERPGGEPAAALRAALEEVGALARPGFLRLGDEAGAGFGLNERGLERLSADARSRLADLGTDPERDSIETLIGALEAASTRLGGTAMALEPPPPDPPTELPYLRTVGVADLLVVKQHLTGYERTDVAHIENVLAGETKTRTHRALDRTEEILTLEHETIQEHQTELETAERFELNREMSRTVQRDQEFGFGLSVSGKYGPTVEFTSNLEASTSTSSEESARSATRYAKDVVSRSLDRVVERVREERVRRVVREQEETNLHELKNTTKDHVSGVYQFVEKVYESQIFNYGIRAMFDFMIPEPASYLWYLEGTESNLKLPTPPPRLDSFAPDASAIHDTNYLALAARFQADGVEPPPPYFVTAAASIVHGQDAPDDGEEGHPRSVLEKDVAVPEGYRPMRALVRPLALTDDSLTLAINVGHARRVFTPGSSQIDLGGHRLGASDISLDLFSDSLPYDAQSKLPVQVVAFETNSYAVAVEVIFIRTPEAYQKWQIKTYGRLSAAYQDLVAKYEATVADLEAQAAADKANAPSRFSAPPSQNLKTIRTELKKHCISIVTRQRYESFDVVQEADPPYFDFDDAAERGAFTRFFEQAFEWDQLQYVCYPYFWSRGDRWASRFLRDDVDPVFLEFLQAGAARVVVPVRSGFEVAVTHYLETLDIWNGDGEPPQIHDPLYLPIVTEIQERTGAPQGELPVGEPWTTRLPTPLAILRRQDDLPAWERVDPDGWEWEEA
jgi:hypothetical protein